MCRRIQCPECKKPTYAGCGMHIEQVLGDVPKAERCTCRDKPATNKADAAKAESSILKRIFG